MIEAYKKHDVRVLRLYNNTCYPYLEFETHLLEGY